MTAYKSDLLNVLEARGFIQDMTEPAELDKLLTSETVTGYAGFDPTADSLHAGHLIPLMQLYWMQQCGHKPIALIGGGTAKVGDPTGKDEMRKVLSDEALAHNIDCIHSTFAKVLRFDDSATSALLVNNDDWLNELAYIPFLREYGKHFTINRMLTMDSVKLRLEREQPLTFLEFNYMILQSYDFVELFKNHGCRLQVGGSDQWGNIVNGVDLGRRVAGAHLFGLVNPLLTTSSGKKMGKTVDGAVWLNADRCSPYDYWQYWRNTEDGDVGRFLKLYTAMPMDEIAKLEALDGAELNEAKKILATEATAVIHGREEAEKAAKTAADTFAGDGMSTDLPTEDFPCSDLEAGLGVLSAFTLAKLAASNGEARRLIKGGGAKVNNKAISDERASLSADDLNDDGVIKLSAGKKRHVLLRPV